MCTAVYTVAMAETVSVRELRENLARYLERAHGGEEITITRAGRVDCRLGPVEERSARTEVEER